MYNVYFQPPLVQACFHGDPDEVRALLYKKEDVNYQVCAKGPIYPLLHRLFIDHDINFYFLENIDKIREKFFMKGCCQLQAKVCARLLVNCLFKLAQEKSVVR